MTIRVLGGGGAHPGKQRGLCSMMRQLQKLTATPSGTLVCRFPMLRVSPPWPAAGVGER